MLLTRRPSAAIWLAVAALLGAGGGLVACKGADTASAPGAFVEPGLRSLSYPTRLAVAADGTVFVSDAANKAVFGYQGDRKTFELGGLERPLGVAVRGSTLFVGDAGRGTVEAYDLERRAFAFALGKGAGEFATPNAIALAPDGDEVLVVDSGRGEVRVFDFDGAPLRTIGRPGTGADEFQFPVALAVDATRVVVADQGNLRVQVFDRDGRWRSSIGQPFAGVLEDVSALKGHFSRPQGVAISDDRILVLDSAQAFVQVFDGQGAFVGFGGPALSGDRHLPLLLDLIVTPDRRLLLTEPGARRYVSVALDLRPMP